MSTFFSNEFRDGDFVIYRSIRDADSPDHYRDSHTAKIMEIKDGISEKSLFPHGYALLIEFKDDLRKTWCRVDEITRV